MALKCIHCKNNHDSESCPLWHKAQALIKVKNTVLKDSFYGSSPAPFIGRFGYPNVFVGILAPPELSEAAWLYDSPQYWALKEYEIPELVSLRSSLINSRFQVNVNNSKAEKVMEVAQEIGMASKPVDVEVHLKKAPRFEVKIDPYTAPRGPGAELISAEITSNSKIHTKVEKVVSDELKAQEAITLLYDKGFDENFLSKLLSVGSIGLNENKRLVPTRWSITATDDMLGKHLIKEIKNYSTYDYSAFFGDYLGNYYLILMFPDYWSYELFEIYTPTKSVSTDYEGFSGRTNYAEECAGGYYTVRLAVAEKLHEFKRQASILVFRFITDEYLLPLGVWVTREASRKAIMNKPIIFSSKELLLKYAKNVAITKFGVNLDSLLKKSKLLEVAGKQVRLTQFM